MMASLQTTAADVRELTDEEKDKLASDTRLVTEFKQMKLEKEAQKNWDLFYKRNTTKFFKDRHWTKREFQDLCGQRTSGSRLVLLEVGCGVGNFIFPLLQEDPSLHVYACDFSPRAVQFVKEHAEYDSSRCSAFQCDLTQDDLTENVPPCSVDFVTMIFVLSAIHPDKMLWALENVAKVLKPGGCVLFRDYGRHDYAQLRFKPGHKLADNFYVRQDGTRAYYFEKEELQSLFDRAGYRTESNSYILRETVNKKEGLCVPRIFVQGKFLKGRDSKDVTVDKTLGDTNDETVDTRNSCVSSLDSHKSQDTIVATSSVTQVATPGATMASSSVENDTVTPPVGECLDNSQTLQTSPNPSNAVDTSCDTSPKTQSSDCCSRSSELIKENSCKDSS